MNHRSSGRNGSVLIVVLVCLGFAATVLMGALRTSCLLYTSPSPRDATLSRMPSSA